MADWHLQTLSFALAFGGGKHYYGTLQRDDYEGATFRLKREVFDYTDAEQLGWSQWEPGDKTERFNTYDDVIETAINWFLEIAEDGDVLYRGIPIHDHREVLVVK